jgi:undecaprenyl-diphosphatase
MLASIDHMNFVQAVTIGLIQGVSELFPISSLGHTVLIPAWIGGSWAELVTQESSPESPYLAFVVGLHLATAIVLNGFYLREWGRLVAGLVTSIATRRVLSTEQRLAWLVVIATVPVGILGIALEHTFRVVFAKPLAAALFLVLNGCILAAGEAHSRRRQRGLSSFGSARRVEPPRRFRDERIVPMDAAAERELSGVGVPGAAVIGASQALALLAGISREGVAMVGASTAASTGRTRCVSRSCSRHR